MQISFGPARALDDGVWTGTLSEAQARRLPGAPLRSAGPHVVMLAAPAWNGAELRAPFDGVSVVALGAGETAIFVGVTAAAAPSARASAAAAPPASPAPTVPAPTPAADQTAPEPAATNDDDAFVAECAQLGSEMERVAGALTHQELVEIEKQIRGATAKHNAFLKELGLSLLPGTETNTDKN